MKDEANVMLQLYKEQLDYCRHHEQQRATGTGLVVSLTIVSIGVITYDKVIDAWDLIFVAIILMLGGLGMALSKKHFERYKFHDMRADHYRDQIEKLLPATGIASCSKEADLKHYGKFTKRTKLHEFWTRINLYIIFVGVALFLLVAGGVVKKLILHPRDAVPTSDAPTEPKS